MCSLGLAPHAAAPSITARARASDAKHAAEAATWTGRTDTLSCRPDPPYHTSAMRAVGPSTVWLYAHAATRATNANHAATSKNHEHPHVMTTVSVGRRRPLVRQAAYAPRAHPARGAAWVAATTSAAAHARWEGASR